MSFVEKILLGLRISRKSAEYAFRDGLRGTIFICFTAAIVMAPATFFRLEGAASLIFFFLLITITPIVFVRRCCAVQEGFRFGLGEVAGIPAGAWWNGAKVIALFLTPFGVSLLAPSDTPARPVLFLLSMLAVMLAGWTAMPFAVNAANPVSSPVRHSFAALRQAWEPIAAVFVSTCCVPWLVLWSVHEILVRPYVDRMMEEEPLLTGWPYMLLGLAAVWTVVLMFQATVATYRVITGRLAV